VEYLEILLILAAAAVALVAQELLDLHLLQQVDLVFKLLLLDLRHLLELAH
jgi:hypothetical protein